MEIIKYDGALTSEVADCYNWITEGLHHCYAASDERVAAILAGEHAGEHLRDEQAWIVRDGGRIVGLAHAGMDHGAEQLDSPRGALRFFAYEVGRRAAGQALIEHVDAHFRDGGVPEVIAFHQDRRWPCFHFEHAYMTDRLTHIEALLGQNGYRRCAGEVYLDWPDLSPPEVPSCGVDVRLETEILAHEAERPHFVVRARRGNEEIARCYCASCGVNAPGSDAEDWALTTWLEVNEEYRGRQLGAHVLAAALHEIRKLGYRHAAISTSWSNYRAQLFYSNFGYQTSDWTYAFRKEVGAE